MYGARRPQTRSPAIRSFLLLHALALSRRQPSDSPSLRTKSVAESAPV